MYAIIFTGLTSTKAGFKSVITAKWSSFMRQVAKKHKDHPNSLYKECNHRELEARDWIKKVSASLLRFSKGDPFSYLYQEEHFVSIQYLVCVHSKSPSIKPLKL